MEKYQTSWIFKFSHFNTIYTSKFRKVPDPKYHRITIDTPDGDFLDIDTKTQNADNVAILCHGLEGSSQSQYMKSMTNLLYEQGWDVIAMNYRGCGGRPNNKEVSYHAGKTEDLHLVLEQLTKKHKTISIIGYSLGGNLVLKYCGEEKYTLDKKIKSVVSLSAPIDLAGGAKEISKSKNLLYNLNFVQELKEKMNGKSLQFPKLIDKKLLKNTKSLYDFDNNFTGPIHGFGNASNYYKINNAKQFLSNISIPCLLIQALDDPFLPDSCYPTVEAAANKHITLLMPKYGGHLGFNSGKRGYFWNELQLLSFINRYTS